MIMRYQDQYFGIDAYPSAPQKNGAAGTEVPVKRPLPLPRPGKPVTRSPRRPYIEVLQDRKA